MDDRIKIVFISNCGLLFMTDEVLIIIDGVVRSDNKFTKHNLTLKKEINDMLMTFEGSRAMLFTHCHNDHFDDAQVANYIINGSVDKIILPFDIENGIICSSLGDSSSDVVAISGEEYRIKVKNVNIRFIKSQHIEYENYSDINHYSIELEFSEKCYLLLGDSAPSDLEHIMSLSNREKVKCIFANPVILGKREWMKKLYDWNPNAEFILYHMPDDDMDTYGYRKMARNKAKEYKDFIPDMKMLFEKNTVVY